VESNLILQILSIPFKNGIKKNLLLESHNIQKNRNQQRYLNIVAEKSPNDYLNTGKIPLSVLLKTFHSMFENRVLP
jgi:hypothetical protein